MNKTDMAKQTESGEESYKLQVLQPQVEELCKKFETMVDRPLDEREDLAAIFEVLNQIRTKIEKVDDDDDDEDKLLPRSKREELGNLLPLIRAALKQRSKQDAAESSAAGGGGADDSKPASAVTPGCIPCNPRVSKQQKQGGQNKEGDTNKKQGGVVSLKLLLRLTQSVLEPEQYYEWTTSYVDEERIYGWDREAGEVMDALVAPDGSERMFRAAGVAGVHGSGKTALAQKVFVHDKAKDNFALRLWVCVGPPDSEDRFNLLYRMLDNLGLDTAKVETIVEESQVVRDTTKKEKDRLEKELRTEAAKIVAGRRADAAAARPHADVNKAVETGKKETPGDAPKKEEGSVVEELLKEEEDRIFEELLKEKIDNSRAVEKSKIGVLLYILNMTLSKTSYMIVFDDIRAYRRDGDDDDDDGCWYSNLTLPPPADGEWGDRLAYGLPKGEHRGAVLVTCRKEDDAKIMARTGLVVGPPKLQVDDAWKLFRREYDQAKDDKKRNKDGGGSSKGKEEEEDTLLKQLEEMKQQIVNKCLGLPVAIIEAARGFAGLEPLPDLPDDTSPKKEAKPAAAQQQQVATPRAVRT